MKTEERIAFFFEHGGYSFDPKTETAEDGRRRCAEELAKAEEAAISRDWVIQWAEDEDGCIGCDCGSDDCDCSAGRPHECLFAALYDAPEDNGERIRVYVAPEDDHGRMLASLGGICNPSREYRRVIEAELADQALANERKGN